MKFHLSEALNDRFRRVAMAVYGYGRGSLSRAAEEALSKWCAECEAYPSQATETGGSNTQERTAEHNVPGINPDERQNNPIGSKVDEKGGTPKDELSQSSGRIVET